jgi:hypothetical protein
VCHLEHRLHLFCIKGVNFKVSGYSWRLLRVISGDVLEVSRRCAQHVLMVISIVMGWTQCCTELCQLHVAEVMSELRS